MTRLIAVGGVDSSGGAGLDADRHAAELLGAEISTRATCHTDQTDEEVLSVHAVDWWTEDLPEGDALKIGLLPDLQSIVAAACFAEAFEGPVVVDPVFFSSSGFEFVDDAGRLAYRTEMLDVGIYITPNLSEVEHLGGEPESWPVLGTVITGGHGADPAIIRDRILVPGRPEAIHDHPRRPGNLRGTGCRFSSALAIELARGASLEAATASASTLVASCFTPR